MSVWFLRHGESEANAADLFAGQREDSPLTQKGLEQAADAGRDLLARGLPFTELIHSPMTRTVQTARTVADILGIAAMHPDARITEYDMGSLTGTPRYKITSLQLTSGEGAEDPEHFRARVLDFLREMKQREDTVLVVSHGILARCIEAARRGMPAKDFFDVEPFPNAHAIELDLDWLE